MSTAPAAPVRRMFGIKDLFTSLNALGGAVAILLCIENRPQAAGLAVLIGYLGDVFDGMVARALGTSNRFGAEYDSISDHLANCIAPAAILFTVQKGQDLGLGARGNWLVAAALGAAIMVVGSVRHARNTVRPIEFKGIWCGMPRPVLGFLVIGYANSQLFPLLSWGPWFSLVVVAAVCWLSLSYLPFVSHHLARRLRPFVRLMVGAFFVTTFGMVFIAPAWAFDVLFFWITGYTLASSTLALTPEERALWRQKVAEARARPEV